MKKVFLLLAIVLSLTACNSDFIYKSYYGFSDLLWEKQDVARFDFSLKDTTRLKADVAYRLIYGYPYVDIKSEIVLKHFGKELLKDTFVVVVRNEDSSYKGDIMGDFIDISSSWMPDTILPQGDYAVTIRQVQVPIDLPFVGEVGLILENIQD